MMKRNKLYTVTKGNMQPLVRSVSNTFDWGGLAQADYQKNPWDYTQDYLYGNGPSIEEQYKNSKNSFGISKADNPFSKGNIGGTMQGIAGAIPDSPMTIGGTTYKRGLFDLADPIHHLAGGNESAVGNAMGDVGVGVFKAGATSGNPFLMIGGAALKALGSGVNALWGTQTNQEKLNAARQGTSRLANYTSNATDFSGVQAPDVVSNVQDPYRGGVFKKGWARRKNAALAEAREDALDWANRSMDNNIGNISNNRLNNALANYSAFGGPIGPIDSVIDNDNMGAIEYGFMSDYLTQKKQAAEVRNKIAGMTPMPAFLPNSFAIGGDVQMNGGDFSTGSVHIDAGKSHSENPNGGVQIGVDGEGVPNLVEEGEVIFNDYVYSNRIQCDEATKNKFHIGKKRELSYADLAKKLEKEIQERPNDPISKAGFQAQMQQLADEQERQKQEMEEERAKEAFEALSPEEKVAVMQGVSARENLAAQEQQQAIAEQQAAMQAAAAQQQPTVQPTPEEIAMAQQGQAPGVPVDAAIAQGQQEGASVMAEGGNLFPDGGIVPYAYSRSWDGFDYFNPETDAYDEGYLNFVNNINQDWVDRIMSGQYGSMERYLAKNKGTNPSIEQVRKLASDKRYSDMHKAMAAAYKEYLAGIDPKTGQPVASAVYDPTIPATVPPTSSTPADVPPTAPNANGTIYHALEGDKNQLPNDPAEWINVGEEIKREVLPNGDTIIYHAPLKNSTSTDGDELKNPTPRHRAEWLRYAGLFGPAAGLGMMVAGVGKPDHSRLDAAVAASSGAPATASYKPIGDYITYNPLDVWSQQNALNAQARATDRAIQNQSSPSRMAGLLASGYNSQIASGNLFRQAQEYNDVLRRQVAEFNRGTNQYNADAYTRNSQFNADALNRNRQFNAQLQMEAARQRADADAGWYNSLYGNVAGLFRGLGDIGTENYRMNRISDMAADGLFGVMGDSNLGRRVLKNTRCNGGKMKKKRGLTY